MLKLFPYQIQGRDFLAARKTALLADEQRLGKAVMTVAAVDKINANLVLVVCRGVARSNWRNEFLRFSSRDWVFDIVFSGGNSAASGGANRGDIRLAVITSYELLEKTLERYRGEKFDVAVIDESHYVKEPSAKRTQLVFGKGGVPSHSKRLWCLTGTPAPNHYGELWTTLFTFGVTRLSHQQFLEKFCRLRESGFGQVVAGSNTTPAVVSELKKLMSEKVLRREAKDVNVQLPKYSFSTVMVPPGKVELAHTTFFKYIIPFDRTAELAAIIEAELGIVNGILDGKFSDEVLETLKAESKSISTLRRYTALQKLEPALTMIAQELESGAYEKAVIFAHHKDCIAAAQRFLHKFHPITLYGGSNPLTVEKNLRRFQKPGHKVRVFIGQINAAGTSICLDAANHIFFLEESFVPGDNQQAAARCGGVNQKKPIFVRTFCLENSYDYRLQEILRRKMSETAALLSGETPPANEIDDLL